jgi:hypothetical protein
MSLDFSALIKLAPLMPRLEKAFQTVSRIENDPDVKDAIAVGEEALAILTAPSQQPNPPADH